MLRIFERILLILLLQNVVLLISNRNSKGQISKNTIIGGRPAPTSALRIYHTSSKARIARCHYNPATILSRLVDIYLIAFKFTQGCKRARQKNRIIYPIKSASKVICKPEKPSYRFRLFRKKNIFRLIALKKLLEGQLKSGLKIPQVSVTQREIKKEGTYEASEAQNFTFKP